MSQSVKKFNDAVCQRTLQARLALNMSRKQMSEALGCSEASVQKYEIRTPLPHHLIPRFCELTGLSSWFLLTGLGREPGQMSEK